MHLQVNPNNLAAAPLNQEFGNATPGPINKLSMELLVEIFSYLKANEAEEGFKVNQAWRKLAEDPFLLKNFIFNELVFGPEKWAEKYVEVDAKEASSALPADMFDILNGPCEAFPGKKVWQTHMLVWIPGSINGRPLTLNSLGELAKKYFPNLLTGYSGILDGIVKEYADKPYDSSRWVLMTKDVLLGSRNKIYVVQQAIVANLAKRTGIPYEVPKVLEAAVCIYAQYFSSRKRLFSFRPWKLTFLRCYEHQIIAGNFKQEGIEVSLFDDDTVSESVGIAALRKY